MNARQERELRELSLSHDVQACSTRREIAHKRPQRPAGAFDQAGRYPTSREAAKRSADSPRASGTKEERGMTEFWAIAVVVVWGIVAVALVHGNKADAKDTD